MPQTKIIDDVNHAAQALCEGLIVAFPTETVYGLGIDATSDQAARRLFEAKGRPADNPLIVHLADVQHWPLAAASMPASALVLLQRFAPGPLTVVVPRSPFISSLVTASLETVGVRIPNHPQARQMLELCGRPIAAPSANRSGRPSCTTWQAVLEDMDGRIDYILRGDVCDVGLESTVVDCINDPPVVLRAGRVTLQRIRELFPGTVFARELAEQDQLIKASPGTRHAHYQPKATIELFETLSELAKIPLVKRAESALACLSDEVAPPKTERSSCDGFVMQASFDSLETYGKQFYEFLREADRRGLKSIYLQLVPDCEQSHALRDRLLRAAGRT